MKLAQKMILVPAGRTPIEVSNLSELDKAMSNVINNNKLSPLEKVNLYSKLLQKNLKMEEKIKANNQQPAPPPIKEEPKEIKEQPIKRQYKYVKVVKEEEETPLKRRKQETPAKRKQTMNDENNGEEKELDKRKQTMAKVSINNNKEEELDKRKQTKAKVHINNDEEEELAEMLDTAFSWETPQNLNTKRGTGKLNYNFKYPDDTYTDVPS